MVFNIPSIRIRGSSCTDIRICIRIRESPSFDICMCIRFRGPSCTDIRICVRIRGSRNFGIRYISNVDHWVCDIYDVAMVMKTRKYVIFMMLLWWCKTGSMWYLWCCYGDVEQGVCDIYDVAMVIKSKK